MGIKRALKANRYLARPLNVYRWCRDKAHLLLVLLSREVLSYVGIAKPSCPIRRWIGWRRLLLAIIGVEPNSLLTLSAPHRFDSLGVRQNIKTVSISDPGASPVTINRNPFDSGDTHTYVWVPRVNYELADVVFDPKSALVLINGLVVHESAIRFPLIDVWSANLHWRCRNPKHHENGACTGMGAAYNYHHWLTEDLMSVLRIRQQYGADVSVITPTSMSAFQSEALHLLGMNRLITDEPLKCARFLLAAQHQRSEAALRPSELALLRETFLSLVDDHKPASGDLLDIYVSRRKSARGLVQEAELETLMKEHGFTVVYTEELSFSEEIALFKQTRTLVCLAGSGLANHFWMPPGGRVIVIYMDDHHFDNALSYTAPLFRLEEFHIDCRRESNSTPAFVIMQKVREVLSL